MKIKLCPICLKIFCLVAFVSLTACGKKEEAKEIKNDSESSKIEAVTTQNTTAEKKAEAQVQKPKVQLDAGLLEELSKPIYPDTPLAKIKVDCSSWEAFEKANNEMQAEIMKLTPEEQKRFMEVGQRLLVDAMKAIPDIQGKMAELQSLPPEEQERTGKEFFLNIFKEFEGKNIYEIADTIEERSQGRPPAEEELKELFESFAPPPPPPNN